MDFTKKADRDALKNRLEIENVGIDLSFQKDDGTVRNIVAKLHRHSELNTDRSVFLKVYDVSGTCGTVFGCRIDNIKTIRWNKIISVAKTLGASVQAQVGDIKKPFDFGDELIRVINNQPTSLFSQDLKDSGFINGKPITDAMLAKFAEIRTARVALPLMDKITELKATVMQLQLRLDNVAAAVLY